MLLQLLGDLKFLENLKDFDKDNIPAPVIKKIREKYVSNETFDPSLIKNISSACEGLCRWVRAIEVYDRVAKVTSSLLTIEVLFSRLEITYVILLTFYTIRNEFAYHSKRC